LQDQGFRALHATDDYQELKCARTARPDLVLLDERLPRMDGYAVCRTLRQESGVSIVMLGAGCRTTDCARALESGADVILDQPFIFRELLAQVRALLRRRVLDGRLPSRPHGRLEIGDITLDCGVHQMRGVDWIDEPRTVDVHGC
jgi:DNA-binding response OmpR family regulator